MKNKQQIIAEVYSLWQAVVSVSYQSPTAPFCFPVSPKELNAAHARAALMMPHCPSPKQEQIITLMYISEQHLCSKPTPYCWSVKLCIRGSLSHSRHSSNIYQKYNMILYQIWEQTVQHAGSMFITIVRVDTQPHHEGMIHLLCKSWVHWVS
jgi:hypothetical protein